MRRVESGRRPARSSGAPGLEVLRFQLICKRGKAALGEGDHSVGELPPYQTRAQQAPGQAIGASLEKPLARDWKPGSPSLLRARKPPREMLLGRLIKERLRPGADTAEIRLR